MIGFLGDGYPWVLVLHVLAIISWMAGMLYLPRLYVYHCRAEVGSKMSETFKTMERLLLRVIINPAMIVSWLTGLAMVTDLGAWTEGWMLGKFAALVGMQLAHASQARWRRHFAADANRHSEAYYRAMNEVPTVFMIAIVILVIVKPF